VTSISSFSAQNSQILPKAEGMEQGITGISYLSCSPSTTYKDILRAAMMPSRELAGNFLLDCGVPLKIVRDRLRGF
jgi:hypothetical protein